MSTTWWSWDTQEVSGDKREHHDGWKEGDGGKNNKVQSINTCALMDECNTGNDWQQTPGDTHRPNTHTHGSAPLLEALWCATNYTADIWIINQYIQSPASVAEYSWIMPRRNLKKLAFKTNVSHILTPELIKAHYGSTEPAEIWSVYSERRRWWNV